MAVERATAGGSLVDVLDRVLDKGIVIDAWVRVSLVGIDLLAIEARIVVASIDTYLKYAEAIGTTAVRKMATADAERLNGLTAENDDLRRRLAALEAKSLGNRP